MSEQTTMQRRMAVQHETEQAINEIIRDMKDLVDNETKIVRSRMEKNQMSNLLSVALETPSVELVKVFILYQAGRDTGGKSWRHENFGEALVKRLDKLEARAKSIAGEVAKKLQQTTEPTKEEIEEVWIGLARHYLGQLNRYFYYRKEMRR